ncbi:adenylate/guanylate cyclase domain-containing protein [Cribrihabitans pelagius]|uniref:adenylate/guanylate cyclase domain-containing protein n=1 Tax=Cribrihabitans pelagius TaxID=1765746 RepID=UPI003B59FCA4
MADIALSPPQAAAAKGSDARPADAIDSQYAAALLEAHKRRGLQLALRARWIALPIIAVFIVFLNPVWSLMYYHGFLALLALNGWFISRVGTVGRSRAELFLIFLDLLIMTFALVVPNPFDSRDIPVAMYYRFDNFQYFFVILAAGTMAFSWRTVIAIGTWTAVMWLGALALVWRIVGPGPGLSHAEAAVSGLGPELAKFLDPYNLVVELRIQEAVVFVLVAVTLGLSVRRFDRLLMNNARLTRERANLSRYFSPNVVEQLSQNDEPLKQVRSQQVAVLFIDIIGFTRMTAERPPREVIALLREFHALMEAEVFRHGGTLDKYLGDGLMATFGTPLAGERDAADALACARAMQAALDAWNRDRTRCGEEAVRAGIGIDYGETLLGDIGANRLEYAVLGMPVNIAARLEKMTRPLGVRIVISQPLADAVRQDPDGAALLDRFSEHPDQTVRGLDRPVTVLALG